MFLKINQSAAERFTSHLDTALRDPASEKIGVHLTEGDMMDPEASVAALVFHHPDARYFGV
ncbi:MAG TPA: vitamin B12 dependent-methionine synthase activation domain-containing protein [Thermoanaerobaculia bacterium]